jgi:hypothetical protein
MHNPTKYRIEAGHYRVGFFTILRSSPNSWQLRDEFDDILDDYRTLRDAIHDAHILKTVSLPGGR